MFDWLPAFPPAPLFFAQLFVGLINGRIDLPNEERLAGPPPLRSMTLSCLLRRGGDSARVAAARALTREADRVMTASVPLDGALMRGHGPRAGPALSLPAPPFCRRIASINVASACCRR